MKAKTLMGMIACAGACVSLSAFGNTTNDWFSVGVSNNAIDPVNCSTNGAAVSIENSKIVLDNEYTTRLAITPAVGLASTNSTDVAKIDVTALLTPSSTNDLAVIDDAKAGFAVGVDDQNATNFYGFANGEWIKLTGDASNADTQDTTFSIVLDYRVPNVRFYLGNTLLASASDSSATAFTIAGNTFGGIDAFGSGSIASIAGGYEVAVAAYNGTKYGSGAEAVIAKGTGSEAIQDVDPSTGAATTEKKASNGLYAWECDVLGIEEDASIALEPATKAVADKITLKLAESNTPDERVTVKFGVNDGTDTTGSYDADCIEIPLTTGTYTIVPVITTAQ